MVVSHSCSISFLLLLQLALSRTFSHNLPSRRCACAYESMRIKIQIWQDARRNFLVKVKFGFHSRSNFRQRKSSDPGILPYIFLGIVTSNDFSFVWIQQNRLHTNFTSIHTGCRCEFHFQLLINTLVLHVTQI